jgi:long-chain acyl-CoA synthetase
VGEEVNLGRIIEGHDDELVALYSRGRPTTYAALRDQVARARGGLRNAGIDTGDRVAIMCGNNRQFVVSYLATVGLGAVIAPLNPSSPPAELERELHRVGAHAVVVDAVAAPVWRRVDRSRVPSVRLVIGPDSASGMTLGDHSIAFDQLLASEPVDDVPVAPDHLAALMFTSGTAGSPRAAMITHGNLLSNIEQVQATSQRTGPGDVIYGVLPLFHIFGLNVVIGASLAHGATVVLVQRFDPATALESVRSRKVTVLPGVPTMWTAFAQFIEAPPDAFASVRVALSGASRLPVEIATKIKERFGIAIAEGYGLTEASPVVTSSAGFEPRFGSVGKVLDGVTVRLVSESGEEPPVGDSGEIWVKGDNVFAGYLDDPEVTARVITSDGWLRTGDIAICDEDGWLYLVDRAKDLIIVSGFNVYPIEVEDVLVSHPAIAEVGVIGVPHPHTGEAVKAYAVANEGMEIDEDALIDYAADHLARYKCPSKIVFVDALPRNANGKLVRRELVELGSG